MKNIFRIILVVVLLMVIGIAFIPDKTMKVTTKELCAEADMSPFLANFIVNTKVGRKVAYLVMKKKVTNHFEE